MNEKEYREKIKKNEWVPREKEFVNYHPIKNGPIGSFQHLVLKVFCDCAGCMVAKIKGKCGYVDIEALSKCEDHNCEEKN